MKVPQKPLLLLLLIINAAVPQRAEYSEYADYQDYADSYGQDDSLYHDYAARQEGRNAGG